MCDHPNECLNDDYECRWCTEVAALTQDNIDLNAQLGKRCVKISGGHAIFEGEIGLLQVFGGAVTLAAGTNVKMPGVL